MLAEFLSALARRPVEWGVDDCSMAIANWWMLNRGVDPAAHLRGVYSTEAECQALVEQSGGLLTLIGDIAQNVEAKVVTQFKPGDFAVITARDFQWGAIRTPSERWFIRARRGAAFVTHAAVLKGWAI